LNSNSSKIEYDAIVAGSGPAGAAVARELSRLKKKVLILERGSRVPRVPGILATASILNAIPVSDRLVVARAFATGGTTSVYFGVATPPPLEAFNALGVDLSSALEQAREELPLAVVPDGMMGAQASLLRDTALDLGHEWRKRDMLVDFAKCPSGYDGRAKWSALDYVDDAVANGAKLIEKATVVKAIVEGNRAVGVEYRLQTGKKSFEVHRAYGEKIVLSAGAATTPLILRESGLAHAATEGFYCHPTMAIFGTVPGLRSGENFVGSMGTEWDDGLSIGDANFSRGFYRMFMLENRQFRRLFGYSRTMGVGTMMMEGLGGAMGEDGRFHKVLAKSDLDRLRHGEKLAEQIMTRAGATNVFKSKLSAGHLGGTIRINEHLDTDLQTPIGNLHVCDSSLIPSEAKVSPTLTLVCVGKYLASRLSASL